MTCQLSCHVETFVVTAGPRLQFLVPTLPPRIQFRQRVGVPELSLCKLQSTAFFSGVAEKLIVAGLFQHTIGGTTWYLVPVKAGNLC